MSTSVNTTWTSPLYTVKEDKEAEEKKKAEEQAKLDAEIQAGLNFHGIDWDNFDNFCLFGKESWKAKTFQENTTGIFQAIFSSLKITANIAGSILKPALGVLNPILGALSGVGGNQQTQQQQQQDKTTQKTDNKTGSTDSKKTDEKKTEEKKTEEEKAAEKKDEKKTGSSSDSDKDKDTEKTSSGKTGKVTFGKTSNYNKSILKTGSDLKTYGAEVFSSDVRAMVEEYNEDTDNIATLKKDLETAQQNYAKAAEERDFSEQDELKIEYKKQTDLAKMYKNEAADLQKDIAGQEALKKANPDRAEEIGRTIETLKAKMEKALANQREAEIAAAQANKDIEAAPEISNKDKMLTYKAQIESLKSQIAVAEAQQKDNKASAEKAASIALTSEETTDEDQLRQAAEDKASVMRTTNDDGIKVREEDAKILDKAENGHEAKFGLSGDDAEKFGDFKASGKAIGSDASPELKHQVELHKLNNEAKINKANAGLSDVDLFYLNDRYKNNTTGTYTLKEIADANKERPYRELTDEKLNKLITGKELQDKAEEALTPEERKILEESNLRAKCRDAKKGG